jgi:hypothetical protein
MGPETRAWIMVSFAMAAAGLGCGVPAAPPPDDDAAPLVHAAVLRYEAKQFLAEERVPICVEVVGSAAGVDTRVREALHPTFPAVRPSDSCALVEGDVYLVGSRVPAALLTSGPIRWIAADEAHVTGGFTRSRASSSRPLYRVVHEAGRWVCLGPVVTGMPL